VGLNGEGEPVFDTIPLNGSELNAMLKLFGQLGMTLTDRRRIEVDVRQKPTRASEEEEKEAEAVANLAQYREATRGKAG
jgi:hypothetical protein